MTHAEIKHLAALQALMADRDSVCARVAGFQACNAQNLCSGAPPVYGDALFFEAEKNLLEISNQMREL